MNTPLQPKQVLEDELVAQLVGQGYEQFAVADEVSIKGVRKGFAASMPSAAPRSTAIRKRSSWPRREVRG